MKRKIIIFLIAIILIFACFFGFYRVAKDDNVAFQSTKDLSFALTLVDEITPNTLWCGSFQLVWNDLIKENGTKPEPKIESIIFDNLNEQTFTEKDLSSSSYYKKYGTPSLKLKEEIEKAIKDKFNEDSDILNDFIWEATSPKDRLFYAMLKKDFKFNYKFTELEEGEFNGKGSARYFGAKASSEKQIKNQVNILYYENEDDFAIVLHSKTDDIIFVKNPLQDNFLDIYNDIYTKEAKYTESKFLSNKEAFKVPYISVKEKKEFKELYNNPFFDNDGNEFVISKALQTIEFNLDEEGGKIKSEAGLQTKETTSALDETKPRKLDIDSTFAMFLVEKGKNIPYYAALIEDIAKFQ